MMLSSHRMWIMTMFKYIKEYIYFFLVNTLTLKLNIPYKNKVNYK